MLEDLFKVVKKRFNDDDNKTETEKPKFKCPRCQHMITEEHYNELLKVCPDCNYHGRMTARERIAITVDKESFVEFDKDMKIILNMKKNSRNCVKKQVFLMLL